MKRLIRVDIRSSFIIAGCLLAGILTIYSLHSFSGAASDFNKASRMQDEMLDQYTIIQHMNDGKFSSKDNNTGNKSNIDNQSDMIVFGLRSFQSKSHESCIPNFKCTASFSTGWKDRTSIQLSTNNTKNKISIVGQEVNVKSKESYHFVVHIKQNKWVLNSGVRLEGFNATSKDWYLIDYCPTYHLNGPMEWQEFRCGFTIEGNTIKIRPVLDSGLTSNSEREATTWFDQLYITKFSPFITDPKLKTQVVYQGLELPVSIAFLGSNDFLVIENRGTVKRIVNGAELSKPLLHVDVERDGLLGIAVSKNTTITGTGINNNSTYVFLYFTEADEDTNKSLNNRLYRYELVNNTLINPKLLLNLPPGFQHNGGPILIGQDKYIYIAIGELDNTTIVPHIKNRILNYEGKNTREPDGRGGILRMDQNGQPVSRHGIIGDDKPLDKYYAYGIRQIFGIDFDPVTGILWDTENGPSFGDEINRVDRGFNSGWNKVQGIWHHYSDNRANVSDFEYHPSDLVDFGGKGKYRSPEFVWKYTVGPTALKFLNSDKLGKQFENDIFVGDVNNGRIYHFKLNQNRTGLLLEGPLIDKVADTDEELDKVVFAGDFGIITDIKVGPDGYLYFVVFSEGKIYRIVPRI